MGSQQKKKKRTKDVRSTTSEIKRTQDLDANKLALQPTFEFGYSPTGVGTIDFVNVTESINSSQTNAPTAPAQVTGLNVTVGGNDNTLNLTWTASGSPAFAYYNIYRSLTTGTEVLVNTSSTNSYADTNLISGTTYYYKVSAVNSYGMEGTLSAEDSATTSGSPPPVGLKLWLALNNNLNDSSPFNNTAVGTGLVYNTPGKFGTHYGSLNISSTTDKIEVTDSGTNLVLDLVSGFSFSFWIRPIDISALSKERNILNAKVGSNYCQVWINSAGNIGAKVFVSGVGSSVKVHQTALTINLWKHVVITFDASSVLRLYLDKVVDSGITTPTPGFGPAATAAWILGHLSSDPSNGYYEGDVDEIMYFKSVVLTQTNINNLFSTNAP